MFLRHPSVATLSMGLHFSVTSQSIAGRMLKDAARMRLGDAGMRGVVMATGEPWPPGSFVAYWMTRSCVPPTTVAKEDD